MGRNAVIESHHMLVTGITRIGIDRSGVNMKVPGGLQVRFL